MHYISKILQETSIDGDINLCKFFSQASASPPACMGLHDETALNCKHIKTDFSLGIIESI